MNKQVDLSIKNAPTSFESWHEQHKNAVPISRPQVDEIKPKNAQYIRKVSTNVHREHTDPSGLTFSPKLNQTSLRMASAQSPLTDRATIILEQKKDKISRLKSYLDERELSQCSFTPHIPSQRQSDIYLKRAGISYTSGEWSQHVFKKQEQYKQNLRLRKEQQIKSEELELQQTPRRHRSRSLVRQRHRSTSGSKMRSFGSVNTAAGGSDLKGSCSWSSDSSSSQSEDNIPPPPPYDEAFQSLYSTNRVVVEPKTKGTPGISLKPAQALSVSRLSKPSTPPVPRDLKMSNSLVKIRSKSAPTRRRIKVPVPVVAHAYTAVERERRERMRQQVMAESSSSFVTVRCDELWLQDLYTSLSNAIPI